MLIYHHPSYTWALPCKDQSSLSGISTKRILPVGFQEWYHLCNKNSRSNAPRGSNVPSYIKAHIVVQAFTRFGLQNV
jgi:hypothetical protein